MKNVILLQINMCKLLRNTFFEKNLRPVKVYSREVTLELCLLVLISCKLLVLQISCNSLVYWGTANVIKPSTASPLGQNEDNKTPGQSWLGKRQTIFTTPGVSPKKSP